jgi:hypothetical protein
MAKAQQRVTKMERHESKVVVKKKCTILDKTRFLEKGIKILDLAQFMWT